MESNDHQLTRQIEVFTRHLQRMYRRSRRERTTCFTVLSLAFFEYPFPTFDEGQTDQDTTNEEPFTEDCHCDPFDADLTRFSLDSDDISDSSVLADDAVGNNAMDETTMSNGPQDAKSQATPISDPLNENDDGFEPFSLEQNSTTTPDADGSNELCGDPPSADHGHLVSSNPHRDDLGSDEASHNPEILNSAPEVPSESMPIGDGDCYRDEDYCRDADTSEDSNSTDADVCFDGASIDSVDSDIGFRLRERFIQFVFTEHTLRLDLPNSTITAAEAAKLLQDRSGFFRLIERPNYWPRDNHFFKFDPVQKPYIYGDELSAAEDIAYVLYELWNCPIDCPIEVKSFASNNKSWPEKILRQ
jgi:hypothetical protein